MGCRAAFVAIVLAGCRFGFGANDVDPDAASVDDASSDASIDAPIDAPSDWFDTAWRARCPLDVDARRVGTLTDFPVLVRVPPSFDYAHAAADGSDLRFTTAGGVLLSSEIDAWNPAGESLVWVRVPALDLAVKTALWMYYDDASATAAPSSTTWVGFTSVSHLGASLADATGTGHDGAVAVGSPPTVAGRIGGARLFDGDDAIDLAKPTDYNFPTMMTASLWISITTLDTANQTVIAKGDQTWRLHRNFSNGTLSYATDAGIAYEMAQTNNVTLGAWHHYVLVYDGAVKRLYLDGVLDRMANYAQGIDTDTAALSIGRNAGAASPRYFKGMVDELRVDPTPRSATWIEAEYATVTDPQFTVFGPPQVLN